MSCIYEIYADELSISDICGYEFEIWVEVHT